MISNITSPETVARWLNKLYGEKHEISRRRDSVTVYKNRYSPLDILGEEKETPAYEDRDKLSIKVPSTGSNDFTITGQWEDVEINLSCNNSIEDLINIFPTKPETSLKELKENKNIGYEENEPLEVSTIGSRFGILLPDSTLRIRKQTGGMACTQVYLDGTYIPLSEPLYHQSSPEWTPTGDKTQTPPISEIDINTRPKRDYVSDTSNTLTDTEYNTLPEWVKDRGHFYNYEEFRHWYSSDDVWMHGTLNLIDELRKYNYDPNGHISDRDMSKLWGSREEIWNEINDKLPFTYVECTHEDIKNDENINTSIYPTRREGIKWIKVTGSKEYKGKTKARWANTIKGKKVMLLYPNSD